MEWVHCSWPLTMLPISQSWSLGSASVGSCARGKKVESREVKDLIQSQRFNFRKCKQNHRCKINPSSEESY